MNKINLNRYILVYLFSISVFVIFYLWVKHTVGNDSSISEWLINYKGGFTRRGLGGEIAIIFSNFFEINLRESIMFLQIFFHCIYLLLLFYYLKNLRVNLIQLFAIFSPIFLFYPIAEIEVLGRKEIFLFLLFLSTIYFSNERYSQKVVNFLIFFIFPIIVLIWEQIVLFAPYFLCILIIKNKIKTFKEVFIKSILIFLPGIITFIYVFLNPISLIEHSNMIEYLKTNFNENCYMSCNLLVSNTIYFHTFESTHRNVDMVHYVRYFLIFLVGFMPLHILLFQNNFSKKDNFLSINFRLHNLFFFLYLPVLLLFLFGSDWGRWINITYTFSILFYLYLLINKQITNNLEISGKNFFLVNKNKLLTAIVFVIFCFGWNPKTSPTGDIGSFPIYRVPYKAIKLINN